MSESEKYSIWLVLEVLDFHDDLEIRHFEVSIKYLLNPKHSSQVGIKPSKSLVEDIFNMSFFDCCVSFIFS